MKVLYVRNGILGRDHYIISEIEITRALRAAGIDARLIVKGEKKQGEQFILPLKVPFNKNRYFVLKLLFYLPFYVIKNRIDFIVVDEKSVVPSIFLVAIKKLFGFRIILDVRTVPVEQVKLSLQQKAAYKIARLFYDGASYITPSTKRLCETKYGLKFNMAAIYSSAVNEKLFTKNVKVTLSSDIADRLKNRFVMIYHGSVTPNRGVTMVLDAINELKDKIPGLLFLSISDNNSLLQKYCSDNNLNLDDQILYLKSADNSLMPQYIKSADVGIIPYSRIKWWEVSSPLKLMEYLSMEMPIVMSNIKAHVDVVPENSDFVVYFNPDNKRELAEKILYAYNNIEYLKVNAYKGREIVLENLTWQKQAERMFEFLKSFSHGAETQLSFSGKKISNVNPAS